MFVEKGRMPDRVKSFREIDSRQDRPRARPGFVKLFRNGLRKIQNLIKCKPSRAETGLAVREIGRKEAGELRGFPILCMGMMEDVFQIKGKGMRRPGKIENMKKKIHARAKKVL